MADLHLGGMVIEDEGEGPEVVMVHGLGGTSNSFQTLMPILSEFRVIRPDLPGAGRSAYRPGVPGMAGLVAAVKNMMYRANIKHAHFVGHSMGTLVCQYLAVESPSLVASLTLFGAILEPSPAARHGLRERAASAREHGMAGIAETVSTGGLAESSRRNPAIRAFVRESLMRQDPKCYAIHCEALSEAAAASHAKIDCPTMLIAGKEDSVAPVAMSRDLAARIHNARLKVVADAGHWMMVEKAVRSAEILRNHLGDLKQQ